ncbi:MAG: DUF4129 domain-containing protein [Xanthomonadales bacterium]|nr:DUF4129 domain-containing protein [Xanthomonadales bacterium]
MQLDKIAIKLRPRGGYEAIDLGFSLAVHWWRSAFLAWWLPVLPLAIALHLGLAQYPWIAVLVLWWLKPLFDRFVLYSLSRQVFGEPTGPAELLGAWRQILSPGLLYALTFARLDPARSYHLPVSILERQSGSAARKRRSLLGRRFYGTAFGLTLVCVNLELIIQAGLSVTFDLFFQPGGDPLNDTGPPLPMELITGQWWEWTDSVYYLIAVGIIEPLYVAAGFSLYLNRRVLLEGWDVELAIKRLAARVSGAAVVLVSIAVLSLAPIQPAHAYEGECLPSGELDFSPPEEMVESAENEVWDPREDWEPERLRAMEERCAQLAQGPGDNSARQAIVKVFEDPIFGEQLKEERWVLREFDDDDEPELQTRTPLAGLGQLFASIWQLLAWLILAALILMLVRYIARSWGPLVRAEEDAGAAPAELFGLQMDPDSLPPQVSETALQWIAEGKLREALGLLYRATLSELVHAHGLRLNRGATEGDVLARTRGRISASASAFVAELINQWVNLAYAEHQPQVDALTALCHGYAQHFETVEIVPAATEERAGESAA